MTTAWRPSARRSRGSVIDSLSGGARPTIMGLKNYGLKVLWRLVAAVSTSTRRARVLWPSPSPSWSTCGATRGPRRRRRRRRLLSPGASVTGPRGCSAGRRQHCFFLRPTGGGLPGHRALGRPHRAGRGRLDGVGRGGAGATAAERRGVGHRAASARRCNFGGSASRTLRWGSASAHHVVPCRRPVMGASVLGGPLCAGSQLAHHPSSAPPPTPPDGGEPLPRRATRSVS